MRHAAADVVIGTGCGDAPPEDPRPPPRRMGTPDPAGADPDTLRRIRDDVEDHVRALAGDLGLTE